MISGSPRTLAGEADPRSRPEGGACPPEAGHNSVEEAYSRTLVGEAGPRNPVVEVCHSSAEAEDPRSHLGCNPLAGAAEGL
eukprot:6250287-Pyramimonas_sp.AAC.2